MHSLTKMIFVNVEHQQIDIETTPNIYLVYQLLN